MVSVDPKFSTHKTSSMLQCLPYTDSQTGNVLYYGPPHVHQRIRKYPQLNSALSQLSPEDGCLLGCSLVDIDRRFRGAYCLHHQATYIHPSSHLHTRIRENLKSHQLSPVHILFLQDPTWSSLVFSNKDVIIGILLFAMRCYIFRLSHRSRDTDSNNIIIFSFVFYYLFIGSRYSHQHTVLHCLQSVSTSQETENESHVPVIQTCQTQCLLEGSLKKR
jgi:hypothetical protein